MRRLVVICCLLLASCESERYVPAAIDAKVDSTLRAAGIGPLQAGKIKIAGNVIINTGPGNVNANDNRKAGQRQGSAATAPNSQASTTAKNAGTPWYVFAGVLVVGLAAGAWLRGRLKRPALA
jgi:hypothetical protein